jgi:CMP-N-acetylneuraminic acid synthetase
MKVAALICARGGSKRIPRKNVQMCAGKKLVEWVLKASFDAKCVERIFVSTDDDEIAECGMKYEATILKRPWQFATDQASNGSTVLQAIHALYQIYKADYVVLVYATSPMIEGWHIDEAYQLLLSKGDAADTVSTVHKFNKTSALNNFFVMNDDHFMFNFWGTHGVLPFINLNLFPVYYQNGAMGIMKITPDFFDGMAELKNDTDAHLIDLDYAACHARREAKNMAENRVKTIGYIVDEVVGWDINYPTDLIVADALLKNREEKRNAGK